MTLTVDLFFSFRSPYSFLATPRLVALEQAYDISINFRPVYPIAVRIDDFFKTVNPLWPPYVFRDVQRLAEMHDIKMRWPNPDPIVQDLATMKIEANQKALEAAGHWGVPTMVFEGEPFFGQDRIDVLIWRLKQNGLAERDA